MIQPKGLGLSEITLMKKYLFSLFLSLGFALSWIRLETSRLWNIKGNWRNKVLVSTSLILLCHSNQSGTPPSWRIHGISSNNSLFDYILSSQKKKHWNSFIRTALLHWSDKSLSYQTSYKITNVCVFKLIASDPPPKYTKYWWFYCKYEWIFELKSGLKHTDKTKVINLSLLNV